MGFLDGIKAAFGGQGPKQDEARSCVQCKNHTSCKRYAMGTEGTCENYDEAA